MEGHNVLFKIMTDMLNMLIERKYSLYYLF